MATVRKATIPLKPSANPKVALTTLTKPVVKKPPVSNLSKSVIAKKPVSVAVKSSPDKVTTPVKPTTTLKQTSKTVVPPSPVKSSATPNTTRVTVPIKSAADSTSTPKVKPVIKPSTKPQTSPIKPAAVAKSIVAKPVMKVVKPGSISSGIKNSPANANTSTGISKPKSSEKSITRTDASKVSKSKLSVKPSVNAKPSSISNAVSTPTVTKTKSSAVNKKPQPTVATKPVSTKLTSQPLLKTSVKPLSDRKITLKSSTGTTTTSKAASLTPKPIRTRSSSVKITDVIKRLQDESEIEIRDADSTTIEEGRNEECLPEDTNESMNLFKRESEVDEQRVYAVAEQLIGVMQPEDLEVITADVAEEHSDSCIIDMRAVEEDEKEAERNLDPPNNYEANNTMVSDESDRRYSLNKDMQKTDADEEPDEQSPAAATEIPLETETITPAEKQNILEMYEMKVQEITDSYFGLNSEEVIDISHNRETDDDVEGCEEDDDYNSEVNLTESMEFTEEIFAVESNEIIEKECAEMISLPVIPAENDEPRESISETCTETSGDFARAVVEEELTVDCCEPSRNTEMPSFHETTTEIEFQKAPLVADAEISDDLSTGTVIDEQIQFENNTVQISALPPPTQVTSINSEFPSENHQNSTEAIIEEGIDFAAEILNENEIEALETVEDDKESRETNVVCDVVENKVDTAIEREKEASQSASNVDDVPCENKDPEECGKSFSLETISSELIDLLNETRTADENLCITANDERSNLIDLESGQFQMINDDEVHVEELLCEKGPLIGFDVPFFGTVPYNSFIDHDGLLSDQEADDSMVLSESEPVDGKDMSYAEVLQSLRVLSDENLGANENLGLNDAFDIMTGDEVPTVTVDETSDQTFQVAIDTAVSSIPIYSVYDNVEFADAIPSDEHYEKPDHEHEADQHDESFHRIRRKRNKRRNKKSRKNSNAENFDEQTTPKYDHSEKPNYHQGDYHNRRRNSRRWRNSRAYFEAFHQHQQSTHNQEYYTDPHWKFTPKMD